MLEMLPWCLEFLKLMEASRLHRSQNLCGSSSLGGMPKYLLRYATTPRPTTCKDFEHLQKQIEALAFEVDVYTPNNFFFKSPVGHSTEPTFSIPSPQIEMHSATADGFVGPRA